MMRVVLQTICLCLLFVPPAGAQVFWELESPEGERSWLLGTIHSEDPRVLDFRPELAEALESARVLALELVLDEATGAAIAEAMFYRRGGSLDETLGKELFAEVLALLRDGYGMHEAIVRRLRPWAAAMTLSFPPPETGVFMDVALSLRAADLGLEVLALETVQEQLVFVGGMPEAQQIEMLRRAVDDHEEATALFESMITMYLESDLKGIEAFALHHLEEASAELREHFFEIGIEQRNRVMLERSLPLAGAGGAIIAVGALHLPGESGLIEGFRDAGYAVRVVY